MKTLLITLVLVASSIGWSKIEDLGEMIHENALVQKKLHRQMKDNQGWQSPEQAPAQKRVVLETTVADYTPKTRKGLLTYKKEKTDHRPSYDKQFNRVAQELNASQGDL